MYRGDEPAFCRACGAAWKTGTRACSACNEPLEASAATKTRRPKFRGQARRLRAVRISLAVSAGAALFAAYTNYDQVDFIARALDGGVVDFNEGLASDRRFFAAYGVNLVAFLVSAALLLTWIFEAGRNLRALGVRALEFTEERRVQWFFVPFASLFMPLLGIKELYRASTAKVGSDWTKARVPVLLTVWWLVWLVSTLSGDAGFALFFGSDQLNGITQVGQLDRITQAMQLDMLSNFSRVLAVVPLLMWVGAIDRGQRAMAEQLPGVERA